MAVTEFPPDAPRIVFLHIPKTAGQTIHFELQRVLGNDVISPIRVHTQAGPGQAQMPPGYRLYSGHIDWDALDTVPAPRFVFTVLRDPLERLASFYFYIRRQAEGKTPQELAEPQFTGMRRALDWSVDDYFCGGDRAWKRFITDHYHTPYCAYLATRRIRGYSDVARLPPGDLLTRALEAAQGLDAVYSVDNLAALERDFADKLGIRIKVAGRYANAAPDSPPETDQPETDLRKRWPKLEAMVEREETLFRLKRFAQLDRRLMHRLGMGPAPERLERPGAQTG